MYRIANVMGIGVDPNDRVVGGLWCAVWSYKYMFVVSMILPKVFHSFQGEFYYIRMTNNLCWDCYDGQQPFRFLGNVTVKSDRQHSWERCLDNI